MVLVKPLLQMVESMFSWVTSGLVAPGCSVAMGYMGGVLADA
jgi:hypothetical protein